MKKQNRLHGFKQDPKEFILDLLKGIGCRNVHELGVKNNINCQCPFHWPKHNTSAFGISYSKEDEGFPFRCYSCGEVGNLFTLIMHVNKCTYKQAEKFFLKRVSFKPINLNTIREAYIALRGSEPDIERYKTIDMPERFSRKPMIKYLKNRNETKQHGIMDIEYIISKYDLFYCDQGRYGKRIIMPIRWLDGRYVYFTNRDITDKSLQKNLFIPDTNSSRYLYGIYESIGRKKVMLVEGPFEVFQLVSYAMKHKIEDYAFVACMGTELNEIRAAIIAELFEEAYILFDNDLPNEKGNRPGPQGEEKAYNLLNDFMPVHKLTDMVYPGKDPAICTEKQLDKIFKYKPQKRVNVQY